MDALTTHQLQVGRRERHRANQVDARHRANQVDALTTHQLQVERRERNRPNQVDALTTHQLQVERRKSVWRGGRGSAKSAAGERLRRQR